MHICHSCGKENQADARFCNWCGAATGSHSSTGLLPAQTLLNNERYAIVERIGQGGMGAVYKALDLRVRQKVVAVKEMSQNGLSGQELQEAIAAFTREAEILAHLNHSSLPHIYQQFAEQGRRYLVMEFIKGETLEQRWQTYQQRRQHMPIEQVLDICRQLCAVLDYLHTQQPPVIFRDLKPANIMLTPQGQVYLIDFGIARLFKPGQVKDTTALGSPGYAPPEQYRQATSPRSDIYSLGATLHQILTNEDPSQNPFHFKPFSLHMPDLEALVMDMTETDEHQRPASMKSVQQIVNTIVQKMHHSTSAKLSVIQPAQTTRPTSVMKPVSIYAIVSSTAKDQKLWLAIREQLVPLVRAFPNVQIQPTATQGQHSIQEQIKAIEQANLVLCFLSEDFLASSACTTAAREALDRANAHDKKVFSVILRPCAWQTTLVASVPTAFPDAIAHLSLYAQEQRILAVARSICMLLATLMLAGKPVGPMDLSQWLLWQFYGNGGANCPYFVIGQYALKHIRPAGRAGVLFHLFDLQTGYAVADYIIGSHTSIDINELLHIIAPSHTTPSNVQGIAMRERPSQLSIK